MTELERDAPEGALQLRVRRVAAAPVVAVRVWIRGGARREAAPGEAWVSGRLLVEGTAGRDWRRIASAAEERGASIRGFGGYELHGVAVDALAPDWQLAVAWAAEMVLESRFPQERVRWVCRQGASELASLWDRPEVRTLWAFLDQLYAPHPRSRPLPGTAESLTRLTAGQCRQFHGGGLRRTVIVSVAGAIDEEETASWIGDRFAALEGGGREETSPPAPEGRPSPVRVRLPPSADQAHLYLGRLTVPRVHPDFPALELAGVVLGAGAGLSGRIPERLRERDGLAYVVQATTVSGASSEPGRMTVYAGTAPGAVERVEQVVREELGRLVEEGVEARELEAARTYRIGREPFRRETAHQWADLMAEAAFWGQPLDDGEWVAKRLEKVSKEEVEGVIRRHLDPDGLAVTVGLPEGSGR